MGPARELSSTRWPTGSCATADAPHSALYGTPQVVGPAASLRESRGRHAPPGRRAPTRLVHRDVADLWLMLHNGVSVSTPSADVMPARHSPDLHAGRRISRWSTRSIGANRPCSASSGIFPIVSTICGPPLLAVWRLRSDIWRRATLGPGLDQERKPVRSDTDAIGTDPHHHHCRDRDHGPDLHDGATGA